MKTFEMPEIEIVELNVVDVIAQDPDWTSQG